MKIRHHSLSLVAAVVAALSLLAAGCGDSSSEDAQALLDKAFSKTVDSGDLDLKLAANIDGLESFSGPLSLDLSGPFNSGDEKTLPIIDWDITAKGAGQSFDAGLTVTDDNAYVEFQGEAYEVGAELFAQFERQYQAQQPDKSADEPTLKSLGLDPTTWLEDPQVEDGEEIGGEPTQVVTGSVDVEKVVRDIYSVTKSDAFRQQLESQGQTVPEIPEPSDEDIEKIADAIDKLDIEINIDEDDIARRLSVVSDFTVPEDTGDGQIKGGSLELDYTLVEVGTEPEIEAPENPKPLSELTQSLGPLLGGGVPQTTP